MVLLAVLVVPAMLERRGADQWKILAIDLPLFLIGTVSIAVYYLESQRLAPRGERRGIALLPAVFALGIGLSISNTMAVLSGLVRRGGAFVRTPKLSSGGARARHSLRRYVAARSRTVAIEAAFALYFAAAVLVALRLGMWLALPFLALFLHGYGWISILHWREHHAERCGSPPSTQTPDDRAHNRVTEPREHAPRVAIGETLVASAGVD
jgi:hypothetical protein